MGFQTGTLSYIISNSKPHFKKSDKELILTKANMHVLHRLISGPQTGTLFYLISQTRNPILRSDEEIILTKTNMYVLDKMLTVALNKI